MKKKASATGYRSASAVTTLLNTSMEMAMPTPSGIRKPRCSRHRFRSTNKFPTASTNCS